MAKTATKAPSTRKTKATPAAEAPARKRRGEQPSVDLQKQVVRLKEKEGLKWPEIVEQTGVKPREAMMAYLVATQPKIEGTEAAVNKAIVKARNDGQSWGVISARTGLPEGRCRKVFEDATGESARGHRIGKGGRFPAGASRPEPKVAAKGSAKVSTTKGTKAAKNAKGNSLEGKSLEQLQKRLNGKTVVMHDGTRLKVAEITAISKGTVEYVDGDGDDATFTLAEAKSVVK